MRYWDILKRRFALGRSALWIIAALMIASAVIRFGAGPGLALANEAASLQGDNGHPGDEQACTTAEELSDLLTDVLTREKSVAERELDLGARLRTVELAEQEIRKNLEDLQAAEERLSRTIAQAETASEDDLARLTSVYESMKPKDASTLFQEMSADFAAGFIARMRPDAAAQVMAGLTPEAAYSISVILAGRNAQTPTE